MIRIVRSFSLAAALTAVLGVTAPPAAALPFTFTGSSGDLSASAAFEQSASNLIVTLTNTSTADVFVPTDVLTAVFFSIQGVSSLTPISALLNGSTVLFGPSNGGDVGGEWAYKSALSIGGATQGISSTGAGDIFGPPDLFGGSNLQGPSSPDGLQYGITSAGDNAATGNTPVTGQYALIKNSVVFSLAGLPSGFQLLDGAITNVSFNYGTGLTTIPTETVPEPASVLLFGTGLAVFGAAASRRRQRRS